MPAYAHDTIPPVPASSPPAPAASSRPARRADAGQVRLSQRDIDGLLLVGEHWGAPSDLLAAALRVEPDRLPPILARWRRAGYAATGRLGPGPGWCWLTRDGMTATGLGFPATRPALGRLAHLRAILAARLWMQANPAWQQGQAWWHSERRLRAEQPAAGRRGHIADAEIHWPSIEGSPYAGQVWAIEVELTPKPLGRTARIMTGLLAPMSYAQVIYLTAPQARPVVTRAAASLPPGDQPRVVVRDLPGYAFTRGASVTPWAWMKFTIFLWLLRKTLKLAGWLLLAVVVITAWPVTVVAAAGYLTAWLRGWPPVRLYRTAAWVLVITAAWLAALEVRVPGWRPALLTPVRAWAHGWDHRAAAAFGHAFLLVAPVAVPAGLALGGVLWAWRIYAITTGLGGITASAPIIFDARQWNRQARTALGLTKAPGAIPLLARGGQIPVGGTIRAIGHKWRPVLAVPAASCARHMVIVGATGSGKTNLMIRLWAGWFTATLQASRAGRGARPLLVVLDCKGGRDARRKADRTRRLLYGAGARRVAVWPDEARLCLWDLPPDELAVVLYQMIDTGTGNAAYYADLLQAAITLAILAPCGPPLSTQAFLDRLNAKWLQGAWGDGRHLAEAEHARAAAKHLPDIQLHYATLLRRLGPALDGPGRLDEADAWYCILEGTREKSVAEAQAMALTELAAHAATSLDGELRAMLLAADDYSAVSSRVPLSNLYERGRSLGIGVQVSAQSWQGLGATEDERYRIAATADGGIFVLHTPYPEPLVALAGTRRVLETAHKLIGNAWGDEGTTREQRAWTADPDLVRRLDVGQACYIHRGAATFVQVARPRPSPLTLLPPPPPPPPPPEPGPEPRRDPAPDPWPPPGGLDDFFDPGATP